MTIFIIYMGKESYQGILLSKKKSRMFIVWTHFIEKFLKSLCTCIFVIHKNLIMINFGEDSDFPNFNVYNSMNHL